MNISDGLLKKPELIANTIVQVMAQFCPWIKYFVSNLLSYITICKNKRK